MFMAEDFCPIAFSVHFNCISMVYARGRPPPRKSPKASAFIGMVWKDIKNERILSLLGVSIEGRKEEREEGREEALFKRCLSKFTTEAMDEIPNAIGPWINKYILLCRCAQERKCTCRCGCVYMYVYRDKDGDIWVNR